jgi:hypothetical protein
MLRGQIAAFDIDEAAFAAVSERRSISSRPGNRIRRSRRR